MSDIKKLEESLETCPSLKPVNSALNLIEFGVSEAASEAFAKNSVKAVVALKSRTVFFSVVVNTTRPMDEAIFREAVEKGLAKDLRQLDKSFRIVGNLVPLSYLEIANQPAAECAAKDPFDSVEFNRLRKGPPYRYAVFAFPAIERNYSFYGPIQTEAEFLKELLDAGVGSSREGEIGSEALDLD